MKSYIALIEGASWSQELSFVYMYSRFNFSDVFYYVLVRSNGKIMIYHFESFFSCHENLTSSCWGLV